MKLLEIFGTETPRTIRQGQTPPRAPFSRIAAGSYGYVKNNPVDPALVAKRNKIAVDLETDGYYQYIKYVVDHNLAENNIHFPRVYGIHLIDNPTEGQLYRIDIEKLEDFAQIDKELLANFVLNNLDIDKMPEGTTKDTFVSLAQDTLSLLAKYNRADIVGPFTAILKTILRGETEWENAIVDKSLIHALHIVKEIKEDNPNTWIDAHLYNYMFRRIGSGIQLVIVDPLADNN
jgi:hypothetical protein